MIGFAGGSSALCGLALLDERSLDHLGFVAVVAESLGLVAELVELGAQLVAAGRRPPEIALTPLDPIADRSQLASNFGGGTRCFRSAVVGNQRFGDTFALDSE